MVAAVVASMGYLASTYVGAVAESTVVPGVAIEDHDVGGLDAEDLHWLTLGLAQGAMLKPVILHAGEVEVVSSSAALGAVPVLEPVIERARRIGKTLSLPRDLAARVALARDGLDLEIGYAFDESVALSALMALAPSFERPSLPTRLDLERRAVLPAVRGTALLPYDSLSAVSIALANGRDRIPVSLLHKPHVEDPLAELAATLNLQTVLGAFDTPYVEASREVDRNHNLKVGAAAVDGTVVMPGEVFSFNAVVGERSAEAGYRYATGIEAGELIDVLGGGICQVSSTLFGAAFFAGLEVVAAHPHSRPSSYVDMGLDATVVWPTVDLKLRNPFVFPVVFHMTASNGKVRAQVLGAERPFQVAFERVVEEVVPFTTSYRDDTSLRIGSEVVAQRGRRGFKLLRQREFQAFGQVAKLESWTVRYRPTTEIVQRGTAVDGLVPTPSPESELRDPAERLRIVQ